VGADFNNFSAEQVVELIQNSLSGDNEKIKQSTRVLKVYTKHRASIGTLSFILANATNLAHRQMAAVLLKRNLINLYSGLSPQEQT
jgi:predicted extracellular nuclease